MKELTKYSRLAMYLEKLFDRLNEDFFDGVLERPVITIQSTPRAYGHYTLYDAWSVKGEGHREINIGAGTLDRPIEAVCCTLIHEMCHQYNDTVLNVQDCSRGGMYHNKYFKQAAEQRGLTVLKTEKYGFSRTEPGDVLLEWILNNNIQEIKITRHDVGEICIPGGEHTTSGGVKPTLPTAGKSNSRRYLCPCCHTIIRATRTVNVMCADCMELMVEG